VKPSRVTLHRGVTRDATLKRRMHASHLVADVPPCAATLKAALRRGSGYIAKIPRLRRRCLSGSCTGTPSGQTEKRPALARTRDQARLAGIREEIRTETDCTKIVQLFHCPKMVQFRCGRIVANEAVAVADKALKLNKWLGFTLWCTSGGKPNSCPSLPGSPARIGITFGICPLARSRPVPPVFARRWLRLSENSHGLGESKPPTTYVPLENENNRSPCPAMDRKGHPTGRP
jgi:hypothetical protein